ncbi:MAG: DUF4160 domain-containing protein [Desulfobacterium sp.]|nr:DUF4160 domain-containing protein [Desulfobacterium sp.]
MYFDEHKPPHFHIRYNEIISNHLFDSRR